MAGRQLAAQYAPANVTTPPGTTAAAPQTTPVFIGDVQLVTVQLRIPPGHSGLTGISVQLASQSLLPWGPAGSWVVGDDDLLQFDVGMEVDAGLTVVTYNTGKYPHTHYLRFVWQPLDQPAAPTLTLVPNDLLTATQALTAQPATGGVA